MPATTGANVRTTGTNRASTMVLAPCWSKKSSVRSMYSRLKNLESGRRSRRGPSLLPDGEADLVADDGGGEAPDQDGGQVELALVGQDPGGEEEGVAGEEEADRAGRSRRR